MNKLKKIDLFIIITFISVFIFFFHENIPNDRFNYDEADYMYAVSKGFFANYTDQNSIPFLEFIQKGKEGLDRSNQTSLSEYVRNRGEIPFYRHYHAPVYFYWMIITEKILGNDEYLMRVASILFHILGFITIYLGCYFLFENSSRVIASITGAFFLFSHSNIQTALKITPHGLYVLFLIVVLFSMAKFFQTNKLKYWYGTLTAICFSILTFEYAVLLLITFLITIFIFRKQLFSEFSRENRSRIILFSFGLFLFLFFIFWPGGIIKLTIMKNYLFFAYFAFVRSSSAYGSESVLNLWLQRIWNSPVEFGLLIMFMGFAIYFIFFRKHYKWLLPFLIYSLLIFLTTFRNRSPLPYYVSSFLPPLYIICGVVFSELIKSKGKIFQLLTTSAIVIALFLNGIIYFKTHEKPGPIDNQLITYFKEMNEEELTLLTPGDFLPTLHYYFPSMVFKSYNKDLSQEQIIKLLKSKKCNGLLFAGVENQNFKTKLETNFYVEEDIISSKSSQVYYYRIDELKVRDDL